jgi:hypothetical protein
MRRSDRRRDRCLSDIAFSPVCALFATVGRRRTPRDYRNLVRRMCAVYKYGRLVPNVFTAREDARPLSVIANRGL